MYVSLKVLHFLALYLLLGGAVFWLGIWRVAYGHSSDGASLRLWQFVRTGVALGAVVFSLSGLADAIRAASQVIEPLTLEGVWQFLTESRYGQMSLLKGGLAMAFMVGLRRHGTTSSWVSRVWPGGCGLGILWALSLTSHAAARPGIFPVVSDVIHVLGAVIWGGGLLYFSLVPWGSVRGESDYHIVRISRVVERFSNLALVAVIAIAASGAMAAFFHVYGLTALTGTPYGRTLLNKIGLFLLALGIASYNLLVLSPALKRQARRCVAATADTLLRRLAGLVRLEALLVMGSLGLAAGLTTLPPAERPPQLAQHAWTRPLGAMQMHLTMVPIGEPGRVRFEAVLTAPDHQAVPQETRLFLYLHMRDHDMGTVRTEATRVDAGRYTASGLLSMAGRWQVEVAVQPPEAVALATTVDFEAMTGTLDMDRTRRLDIAAAQMSLVHAASCLLGLSLGALAAFTIWASRKGRLPVWTTLLGLFLMACGGYFVLRVVLVDAYPTTYVKNPLPSTPDVVARGRELFQTHCTTCHGRDGRGDGPAAANLNPRPADLTAAHVDNHTDGDLLWWLTNGIDGTAMPAWEETLSVEQRWTVIHYIRERRRK